MTIRAVTAADEGQLTRTAWRAFSSDPQIRYIVADDDRWHGGTGETFFGIAVAWFGGTGRGHVTDDVAALCLWAPSERPEPPPEVLATLGALNERMNADERARATILMDSFAAHKPAEPHVYIGVLATHPDWQRRGLGRQAMGPAFAFADEAGLGTYLETGTEANVAFYRSCGFEVSAEWDIADGPRNWGMWRPPR